MPNLPLLKFAIDYEGKRFRLTHSPIGWNESEFKENIVESYFVLRREYSTALRLVLEGHELLKKIVYSQGIEAVAQILIEKLNSETWQYEQVFFGEIDLSKLVDDRDSLTINAMQGGMSANIKAYENVPYEIPLDENSEVVNIGGIGVSQFASYVNDLPHVAPIDQSDVFSPEFILYEETVDDDFIILNEPGAQSGWAGVTPLEPFCMVTRDLRVKFTISIKYASNWINNSIGGQPSEFKNYLDFYLTDFFNVPKHVVRAYPIAGFNYINIDVTLDLLDNTSLLFYIFNAQTQEGSGNWMGITIFDFQLRLEYSAYTDDYKANAISGATLYAALLKKMNPTLDIIATSNLLNTEPWNRIYFTSGDGLRGLPNAKIKTTFLQFFEAMNALTCTGFDIKGSEGILELRRNFYNRYIEVVDIGEVLDMKIEPAIQYHYTSVRVGTEDQSYDKTDGRDEFNTEVEFVANDQKRVQKKLDIICPYRTDPRGVDQLLIDFRADPTRDTKSDNDTFALMCSNEIIDGVRQLEGTEKYTDVQGTSALGRIYNIFLSPWRMLQRHSSVLSVPYQVKQLGQLDFSTSKKNANLVTTDLFGNVIREKDSLTYDKMESPLFAPFLATVSASMSDTMYDKIRQDTTYGYIKWSYRGKEYKGFRLSSGFDIVEKSTKEIKFIFHPDTNLL